MNGTRAEASSGSQVQTVENLKIVQNRLKTLVLTLKDFNNSEKQDSKSKTKRESFFRELNQMRNQVTTYVNDIERQVIAIRPRNTNDEDYVDKVHKYLLLVQLTTDILKKLNQLFTEIFDKFSTYIEELWNHMQNGDNAEARRVTQEFNAFFNGKTSDLNSFSNDVEQLINDINNAEQK